MPIGLLILFCCVLCAQLETVYFDLKKCYKFSSKVALDYANTNRLMELYSDCGLCKFSSAKSPTEKQYFEEVHTTECITRRYFSAGCEEVEKPYCSDLYRNNVV